MYRLQLKNVALGNYNEETKRYERIETSQVFNCESLPQLTGLIEFMAKTSRDELEITISRMEDNDE